MQPNNSVEAALSRLLSGKLPVIIALISGYFLDPDRIKQDIWNWSRRDGLFGRPVPTVHSGTPTVSTRHFITHLFGPIGGVGRRTHRRSLRTGGRDNRRFTIPSIKRPFVKYPFPFYR
jgi:hypothetical protein